MRSMLDMIRLSNAIGDAIPERPVTAALPVPAVTAPEPEPQDTLTRAIQQAELETLYSSEAESIPSVRKALHVIAGTVSTFGLAAWQDTTRLAPDDRRTSWLTQPDPDVALQVLLSHTVRDIIWRDRAYWRVLPGGRFVGSGLPASFRRVDPGRVTPLTDPDDVDHTQGYLLDGRPVDRPDLVVFDGAGIGGLKRFGWSLLDLYLRLMTSAANYASAPVPQFELHNTGQDLDDTEIGELLDGWEQARKARTTAYTSSTVESKSYGWSARELQLVEAREEAALEVARLFGLPAQALDAPVAGSSLTYANVTEARRGIVEALRPWLTVIEAGLSVDDRSGVRSGLVLPRGIVARFDVDPYLRDDPATRMSIWSTALTAGILSVEEVRAQEPLAWTGGSLT